MTSTATSAETEILAGLNRTYIRCVAEADTKAFAEILADDFLNSNPDGTLVDKTAFLRQIESIGKLRSIDIDDVRIRVFGETAVIHAQTRYVLAKFLLVQAQKLLQHGGRNGELRAFFQKRRNYA